jgi:hypothetical protein
MFGNGLPYSKNDLEKPILVLTAPSSDKPLKKVGMNYEHVLFRKLFMLGEIEKERKGY